MVMSIKTTIFDYYEKTSNIIDMILLLTHGDKGINEFKVRVVKRILLSMKYNNIEERNYIKYEINNLPRLFKSIDDSNDKLFVFKKSELVDATKPISNRYKIIRPTIYEAKEYFKEKNGILKQMSIDEVSSFSQVSSQGKSQFE